PLEAAALFASSRFIKNLPQGDGHPVMVLPPYMASDTITTQLRRAIESWGYETYGWGLGANLAHTELNTMEGAVRERHKALLQVEQRLDKIYQSSGQRKVSLVGWSLGGMHACELARRNPDKVRQIMTLGSPLGDPRGTAIFAITARITGNEPSDAEIARWVGDLKEPLRGVPATSIYSESDGVVVPYIAKLARGPQAQNICVKSSHVGMAFNRRVFFIIADRLAVPEKEWVPFRVARWKKWLVS
ncbi:MAG: alpha/beta fold hydrolase, partial [Pseudomonadales bacterium]